MIGFRRRARAAAVAAAAPAPPILGEYERPGFWQGHRRLGLWLLGGFAFLYGMIFAVTTTYLLLQLAVPLIFVAVLIVWVLPETGTVPEKLLERLFFAFLIALLCWPDYLALALPGLPWITAIRMIAVPLALVFLVALSQSRAFRAELMDILGAAPAVWKLLTAFALLALLSIGVSTDPGFSMNKFIVAMLYWTLIFFVACWVFTRPGRAWLLAYLLWFIVLYVCLIGIQEERHQVVPWAGRIPSFLVVQDESVQRILAGARRAATGIYRVQSKFTTSLGLAEFLAYAMPFTLHIAFRAPRRAWRVAAWLIQPLSLYVVVKTDARLGMVGFFSTVLLYSLYWGASRWRTRKDSLFGPALVLSFPLTSIGFFISTFLVGRLGALVWGTGAQSFSTESRKLQVATGIPKLFERPWGYGLGRAAETLGFRNGADVLTIDTYYLAMALDLGILGFIIYYAIFIAAILIGLKRSPSALGEISFIAPATIAMINFVIIKSIFSQIENHPLVFALLGLMVALTYRQRQEAAREPQAASAPAPSRVAAQA